MCEPVLNKQQPGREPFVPQTVDVLAVGEHCDVGRPRRLDDGVARPVQRHRRAGPGVGAQ